MVKEDLMEHASSAVDFYELLDVAFETSESDIRRAYRKTALKYHPDKLGKDFDPEKFHLLQIANDVLSDPTAKAAYDRARNARLQKQRQSELFKGKRRQMKEDLEAREREGSVTGATRAKRPREEAEMETQMETEIRRLAEEGRRRRKETEERMRSQGFAPSVPIGKSSPDNLPSEEQSQNAAEDAEEEDEVAKLERRIREVQETKIQRKAEKKARRRGDSIRISSPAPEGTKIKSPSKGGQQATLTPIKRPGLFKDLKADKESSASPKFTFSPKMPTTSKDEFSDTVERLRAAERKRLGDEIRKKDADSTQE